MIRTKIIVLLANILLLWWIFLAPAYAKIEKPQSMWLPTFSTNKDLVGDVVQVRKDNPHGFLTKWIAEWIKYVWLLAVISLIIGWFMYMISYWSDDKTKKAKNIIMYSIIGVLVSIAAYSLVDIINNISLW